MLLIRRAIMQGDTLSELDARWLAAKWAKRALVECGGYTGPWALAVKVAELAGMGQSWMGHRRGWARQDDLDAARAALPVEPSGPRTAIALAALMPDHNAAALLAASAELEYAAAKRTTVMKQLMDVASMRVRLSSDREELGIRRQVWELMEMVDDLFVPGDDT
jgi:hypothetical protein